MARFADHAGLDMRAILAGAAYAVMTACTIASDANVAERCRAPATWRMTSLAIIADRNMVRFLAGSAGSVVATGAIADYAGVIEPHNRPRTDVVARLAVQIRGNVVRRLANHLNVIVAVAARPNDLGVIETLGGIPGNSRMAIRATFRRQDVIRRLARRAHSRARRMARGAVRLGPLENAVDVAGLASHLKVGTRQLETGAEMIERGSDSTGRRNLCFHSRKENAAQHQAQYSEHRIARRRQERKQAC